MEILLTFVFVGLSTQIRDLFATSCYQEMNYYHERYGYGNNIGCTNLNDGNVADLKSFVVYNKVRLVVDESNLTRFDSNLFRNIPNAKEVIIARSRLDLLNVPKEGPFENLPQLEYLAIVEDDLNAISENLLNKLYNLRAFNVSSNNLSRLRNGTLRDVRNLQELDLSRNRFRCLREVPLCEARQLKRLYATHNRLSALNGSSVGCLRFLTNLRLDFNEIAELVGLSSLKRLIRIGLSYNAIGHLGDAFAGLDSLEELNLEGNRLTTLTDGCFEGLSRLARLYAGRNSIKAVSADALASLKELDLRQNGLDGVPVGNSTSLEELDVSNNPLSFDRQRFDFRNLRVLGLSRCNIREVGRGRFRNLGSLRALDLSDNRVALDGSSFIGLDGLRRLNLSRNHLATLPANAFDRLVVLEILDLSGNVLRRVGAATFGGLKALATLDLSGNYLESVSDAVLLPMENLRQLDLEGNRLERIDYNAIMSLLTNLKSINVRDNDFSCQFLTEMLRYFGDNNVNFTINKKWTYHVENVEGIGCRERDEKKSTASLSALVLILSFVVFTLSVCIVAVCYRVYFAFKRRAAICDEIELLDARAHKRRVFS